MEAYFIHLGTLMAIYVLMSVSFNITVGYAGLLNLGHVALMAVGGYASTILSKMYDVPFVLSVLVAVLLTMVVSGLLAIPAKKIKGDYYALVTLGFLFLVNAVLINWTSLTRGTLGIPGIPRPEWIATNAQYFVFATIVAVVVYVLVDRMLKSPFGRALEAVRDDEEVAASLGKPVFKFQLVAMMLSGAIVGLSGALLAHYIQFISPLTFWLELLVYALAGVMLGGLASMPGSVLGILIIFLIEDVLRRQLSIPSDVLGPMRLIVFMLVLIGVILFKPKGILGRAQLDQ